MKIRFEAELEEAVQFVVDLPEPVKEYAESLLIIINNAREYPKNFYKVENNPGNTVYVTCPIDSKESVKEFLEWRGTITEERRVLVCKPEYVWTRPSAEYLDSLWMKEDAPNEIVTLAPDLE